LWTGLAYVLINGLVGNLIEPRFMGKGLGLSPLIVFISLVFWGWVLGPVGMFLSIPLTITLKIALDSSEETRKFAQLLG
jgi:predicted PurR-regulated permease PerM